MEIIDLEMIPGGPKKTCHASQFDNGRVIRFNLKENGQPFALSGTETVQAIIRKPDGSETTLDIANTSSTYVDLITEEDTCDIAGVNHCEMKVTKDGEDLGSGNFDMKVEEDAYGGEDITIGEASGPIASFETNIKDDLIECVCEINPVQDLHGYDHPWPAGGGKNLLDYSKWEGVTITRGTAVWENNGVTLTATERDAYTQYVPPYLTPFIKINPGDSIWVSWQESTNTEGQVLVFTSRDGSWGLRAFTNNSTSKSLHYTVTDEDEGFLSFRFGVLNQGDTISYKNIQIEKGSSPTAYEPYENVCPIEGHTEMDIIRSGVNLWDKANVQNGYIDDVTGEQRGGTGYRNTGWVDVQPGVSYYIKTEQTRALWGAWYDINKNFIAGITSYAETTITAPENAFFMRLTIWVDDGSATSGNVDTFGVNYPSTDHTYHPAEIIEKTIQLGQTVYRGRINITTGQGIIDMAEVNLGDLTWLYNSNLKRFYARFDDGKASGNATGLPALCDIYPVDDTNQYNNLPDGSISVGSNYISGTVCAIVVHDERYSSEGTFKTAMSGHKVTCELATPVIIQLTPEQIETLLGQKNNVYHTANGNTAVKFFTRA